MSPVVLVLIIANVAVFGLQRMMGDPLVVNFALWPMGNYTDASAGITVGFQPWQLVTSAFLHGNTTHLLLNMFALYMFGRDVELAMGSRRFTWLYAASVLTASVVQLLVVTASVEE